MFQLHWLAAVVRYLEVITKRFIISFYWTFPDIIQLSSFSQAFYILEGHIRLISINQLPEGIIMPLSRFWLLLAPKVVQDLRVSPAITLPE